MGLALNNLQRLICHKTQQTKPNIIGVKEYSYREKLEKLRLTTSQVASSPRDRCSIPGRVIPKTLKMVLDTSRLNTQHYKVRVKSKVEQSRERSSALPNTSV